MHRLQSLCKVAVKRETQESQKTNTATTCKFKKVSFRGLNVAVQIEKLRLSLSHRKYVQ